MIRIQNYVMAESLEQAYQLNQNKRSRILGGMLWLKLSNIAVHTAIDLSRLGLNAIEETEEEFSIMAECIIGTESIRFTGRPETGRM